MNARGSGGPGWLASGARPQVAVMTARAAAIAMALAALLTGCGSAPARPSIVLIVIDTLRADVVSSYGNPAPTTPRIDALAARGLRFTQASSASAWTLASHATLFTGLHPAGHHATQEHPFLDARPATLAEILRESGYATFGVSANPLVSRLTGLDRGFETFVDSWRLERGAEHPNVAAARAFFDGADRDRPFFLFANFMEAHHPYTPNAERLARFVARAPDDPTLRSALARSVADFYAGRIPSEEMALLRRMYDAEVAAADEAVGDLLDLLAEQGRLERTLVVVTSDHGETFGEHGHFRHVFHLDRTVTQVPLVIVPPGGTSAQVRSDPVGAVDVFRTLVARSGAVLPPVPRPGRDLLSETPLAPVFSEYYYPSQALANLPDGAERAHPEVYARFRRRLRAVTSDGLRLLAPVPGTPSLFEVESDAREERDLHGDPDYAARESALAAELSRFIEAHGGERPLPSAASRDGGFGTLSPEEAERLRALGYLAP